MRPDGRVGHIRHRPQETRAAPAARRAAHQAQPTATPTATVADNAAREGSTSGAQQRPRRGTQKNLATALVASNPRGQHKRSSAESSTRHGKELGRLKGTQGQSSTRERWAGQNFVSAQLEHCTCGDCTNILHAKSSKLTLTFTNAERISKLQAIKEEFLQRHKFENARHGSRSSYEVGFADGARLSAVNFFINGFSISSVKQISSSNKVANESFKNHNTSTAA